MTRARPAATRRAVERRSRGSSARWAWGVLSILLTSCVPSYAPPGPDAPHALLKLRRRYSVALGPTLRETFSVSGESAFSREVTGFRALSTTTDVILARPGKITLTASAEFYHMQREPGYPIGYCGGPRYAMGCYAPSRIIRVTDAFCSRSLELEVEEDEVYLFELAFVSEDVCRLVCYRQKPGDSGRFQMLPCVAP